LSSTHHAEVRTAAAARRYFTQLKYRESGFELAKKLTILR
jgi:hypothetical protein